MTRDVQPVANGIRTDHPIPGLPFVDDSHIPIDDPDAVEALGRHDGTDMWGRCDTEKRTGQWAAYTTDPKNHAFAWLVRYHPEHGRSVTLYRDGDGSSAYQEWFGDRALLSRLGGYWWDGQTWYRPRQVLDWATERYARRPVRQPMVITAADLLDGGGKATLGTVGKIVHFEPVPAVPAQQWRHDLAVWALRRRTRSDALPPERCVVTLNAPELAEGSLLGVEEFAAEAGIAASTLRAYLSRDEADLPLPQSIDGNRKRWAAPVVRDWVEQRRRDTSTVATVLTGDAEDTLPPGLRRLWTRLTKVLFRDLWGDPASRRRWSRPHRTEQAVQSVAEQAGWIAALHLDSTVPFDDVAWVIERAVLDELGEDRDIIAGWIFLSPAIGKVLGWFIEHKPSSVPALFGSIVREAERRHGISPAVTGKSLKRVVRMDGKVEGDPEHVRAFLDASLPPDK